MISKSNMEQILEMQDDFYSQRIGTIYGDFKVTNVWYDWETRKQMWKLRCVKCGIEKTTHNGSDYRKGKNKGNCGCVFQKEKEAKERKKKIAAQKRFENSPANPKWVGRVFNNWKVLGYETKRGWVVECLECKRETHHAPSRINSEKPVMCTCQLDWGKYSKKEWVGQKHNHLTIQGYVNQRFVCACDCGRKTEVIPVNLLRHKVKSCGDPDCEHHVKLLSESSKTHGMSGTRLYKVWNGMHQRCTNPINNSFEDYGGRGITVCDDWQTFEPFCEWAIKNGFDENKSGIECSMDRIDTNGIYEPLNCRWTNAKVQRHNQRPHKPHKKKHVWMIDGKTKSVADWCAEYNLSVPTVMYRIKTKGMTPSEALTTPKKTQGRPKKNV